MCGMACRDDDLPFRIELWDDGDNQVEELIALVGDFFTVNQAFEEAMKRRPGKLVILKKARVLRTSRHA
jgi:hypothetical protein